MATNDVIYLRATNGDLQRLQATAYESESLLQEYLASHPDLLAGGQMGKGEPARFLLVRREMPVPDEIGIGRWSLDHLYVDQHAVPTFVEVKRGTNTEIRRRVVGQMLDYVANGQRYWSAETLQTEFATTCGASAEPATVLGDFLGEESVPAAFFEEVLANLERGRVRMLFVADVIPAELRRIVEFLNAQMKEADVLAVEVKQYVGSGHSAFVPRVLGVTTKSETAKGTSQAERFEDYCIEGTPCWEVKALLEAWALEQGLTCKATLWSWQVCDGPTPLLSLWRSTTQLYLSRLVRAGLGSEVAQLRAELQAAASTPLTEQRPAVQNADVIAKWELWQGELMPKYRTLVRRMVAGGGDSVLSDEPADE